MPDLREQLQLLFQDRVCLMGVGNVAYGDDGFGVRLAEGLKAEGRSPKAEGNPKSEGRSKDLDGICSDFGLRRQVTVAGTSPERFINRVADEGFDHLIFLDAVEFGGAPGSVVLLNSDEIAARFPQVSTHKLSLGLLARQVEANGRTKAWLLGVQPELLSRVKSSPDRPCHPRAATGTGEGRFPGGVGMTPEQSVIVAIVICIVGAVLTLLASRNKTAAGWLALVFTTAAAVVIVSAVAHVLVSGPGHQQEFPLIPQIGLVLRVYVDGLTAVFLLLAALISVPVTLYSIVYMRNYEGYSVARYYPYFLLFLAAMYGLVSTTDMMWFFLIFWQMMTLLAMRLSGSSTRTRPTSARPTSSSS